MKKLVAEIYDYGAFYRIAMNKPTGYWSIPFFNEKELIEIIKRDMHVDVKEQRL